MTAEKNSKLFPIVAALAHPVARKVFAEIELGQFDHSDEQDSKIAKALTQLERAAMIKLSKDQGYVVDSLSLSQTLKGASGNSSKALSAVDLFLREGKIRQFPAKAAERDKLMRLAAAACFSSGAVLTEEQVDERLGQYHEDTALMRRYMVDHKIVQRTDDGSQYWLS